MYLNSDAVRLLLDRDSVRIKERAWQNTSVELFATPDEMKQIVILAVLLFAGGSIIIFLSTRNALWNILISFPCSAASMEFGARRR